MAFTELDLAQMLKNPNIKIKEDKPIKPNLDIKAEKVELVNVEINQQVKMNKLETSYGQYLDVLKYERNIKLWMFEPFNLRLASPKCFYKIDFLVINKLNQIELHETKGDWVDGDALVKFKVAATQFPFFIFKWIVKDNGNFVSKTLIDGKWQLG